MCVSSEADLEVRQTTAWEQNSNYLLRKTKFKAILATQVFDVASVVAF